MLYIYIYSAALRYEMKNFDKSQGLCAINSKINGTPKGDYLPISKLHSILAIANLLAHYNLWLCYYGLVQKICYGKNRM